ncbi:MAG: PH domain-containing protein [Phycisphaerales bacterium]
MSPGADESVRVQAAASGAAGAPGVISETRAADPVSMVAEDLQDGEVVILALRPHPLFILFTSAASLLALVAALLLVVFIARRGWLPIDASVVTTYGLGLGVLRVVWQVLVWFNEGYLLTNRRVVRTGGVFRRFRFECQLRRIQHLAMAKSIPERIFGLGTIGFATAGTGAIETAWLMVGKADRVFDTVQETVRNAGGGDGPGGGV